MPAEDKGQTGLAMAAAVTQGNKMGGARPTIAVIIPTYNHARFLPEAIGSILAQTLPADEIIVVDDGSTDDPAAAVARFAEVKLVRQENRGLSAARNYGLRNTVADYVAFLDADDRFLDNALETGLACMLANPASGFVYGASRRIFEDGRQPSMKHYDPVTGDAHIELLKRNAVSVHHSVLYRRDRLVEVGCFDETLKKGEDLDAYLRLAIKYPVASHPNIIAEYRRHDSNMSNDHFGMMKALMDVLDRHAARIPVLDRQTKLALAEGKRRKCAHYAYDMLAGAAARWRGNRDTGAFLKEVWLAFRWAPGAVAWAVSTGLMRRGRELFTRKGAGR